MADDKPIIIVKKKGGHGGHHGGAWKVAYADFVTAMMAFFMVMWLVNSADVTTKKNIASYFRRPGLFQTGSGTPLMMGESGILNDAYSPPRPDQNKDFRAGSDMAPIDKRGAGAKGSAAKESRDKDQKAKGLIKGKDNTQGVEVKEEKEGGAATGGGVSADADGDLTKLAEEIRAKVAASPELQELLGLVEIRAEADGITIDIMDTARNSMFMTGSAQITPSAAIAFQKVASILKKAPNQIDIVGHTDATPYVSRGGLTNWELSSNRANAARKLLEQYGIPPTQINGVIGRADRELHDQKNPSNPSNRRISLKVKFTSQHQFQRGNNGRNLEGLDKIISPSTAKSLKERSESNANRPIPTPRPTTDPLAGGYRPKVERKANEVSSTIPLPEEAPVQGETINNPSENLFRKDPVLGPPDPFSGF